MKQIVNAKKIGGTDKTEGTPLTNWDEHYDESFQLHRA